MTASPNRSCEGCRGELGFDVAMAFQPNPDLDGGEVWAQEALGIAPVAEGVETEGEMRTLRGLGISPRQGFLFARPRLGTVPCVAWPEGAPERAGAPVGPA